MSRVLAACAALVLMAGSAGAARGVTAETVRWQTRARAVVILRDQWGIAHVYGRTDADAVFGAMYAQAEDDFQRIERNYLIALGRLAQAEGESGVIPVSRDF
jgi:acyl-homoserine-lactone acylase